MTQSLWPDGERTQNLLDQAKQGDASAVDSLLDKHRDSLRHMIQMRLDHRITRRVDVSDVVQEVLVEASRRLQDYLENPKLPFHLWIRQIAKDRIIDAHRRHRVSAKRSVDREQAMAMVAGTDPSTMDLVGQLRDPALTPAAAATQREIAKQVEGAIQLLKEADREIILMRHYEQLSNQDVAQVLNLSEPATSMRYLRAMQRLRDLLDQNSSTAGESAV